MWIIEDLFGDDLDAEDALDKAHSILNELRKWPLVDDGKDYLGQKCVKCMTFNMVFHRILQEKVR